MALVLHVVIAILSVTYITYLYIFPSESKLKVSYGLITLTLSSGTYLVWSTHVNVLHVCTMGLLYTGIVILGIASARKKIASFKAVK